MYVPNQGDIIYLTLNPQSGHEQSGRRPVLVISKYNFNNTTKLAVVCPITNAERKVPTHVELKDSGGTTGFVMCEQVKSLDLKTRKPQYKGKIDNDILAEAIDIVQGFIDLDVVRDEKNGNQPEETFELPETEMEDTSQAPN